jgi:hypothetical protein
VSDSGKAWEESSSLELKQKKHPFPTCKAPCMCKLIRAYRNMPILQQFIFFFSFFFFSHALPHLALYIFIYFSLITFLSSPLFFLFSSSFFLFFLLISPLGLCLCEGSYLIRKMFSALNHDPCSQPSPWGRSSGDPLPEAQSFIRSVAKSATDWVPVTLQLGQTPPEHPFNTRDPPYFVDHVVGNWRPGGPLNTRNLISVGTLACAS